MTDTKTKYAVIYDIKTEYPPSELHLSFTALFFCVFLAGMKYRVQKTCSQYENKAEDITIWPGLEKLKHRTLRTLPLGPAFDILAEAGYPVNHDFSDAAP